MPTHTIRLRGHFDAGPSPLGDGRTRSGRRFGRPTGVAADQSVWLAIDARHPATVYLNGERLLDLAAPGWHRACLGELPPRNLLEIDHDGEADFEVVLEIVTPA